MKRTEPLALYHSWHLYEQERRFELGCILDSRATEAIGLTSAQDLARQGIGQWHCDLADNSLTWSDAVYDIFEMPRGAPVTRDETVALFCEESRAAMERLRAYAIKHHRGFTLDAEIRPSGRVRRWMRLIAAPLSDNGRVVRLHGLKRIIPSKR